MLALLAMAAVSIRGLDEDVKRRLQVRAAQNGRSMEAEIRVILGEAVADPGDEDNLGVALYNAFQELGGVELELPPRNSFPRPVEFPE